MIPLTFGLSSYERAEGNLPEMPVVNMYAEEAPTENMGVVLQSRQGLVDRAANMGTGPVEALFKADGVLSGALYGVSDGTLYEATTSKGTIAGSGPVSIAGNELGLMITAGTTLYYYNGTTLATVTFPDSANVVKVISGASRFIALRENSGKFYWTDSLEADVEALDFATAETKADRVLDALFIDDVLLLFGAETIEFWPNTTSATTPFVPLEGRVIERGIKATGCATAFGPTFAWVTNENEVCVGSEENVISNPGLQVRIGNSTDVRLFTFFFEGYEFLALRLDTETQVYNRRSGLWSEFTSYGASNFGVQCYADDVFGSATDGKTFAWSGNYTDGTATSGLLERRFRAGTRSEALEVVSNIVLHCNVGQTPDLTGTYANPVVELRTSLDEGQTWGEWKPVSLGVQGDYDAVAMWRALGRRKRHKGWLCEIRTTAPVPFRASAVVANEPYGGR